MILEKETDGDVGLRISVADHYHTGCTLRNLYRESIDMDQLAFNSAEWCNDIVVGRGHPQRSVRLAEIWLETQKNHLVQLEKDGDSLTKAISGKTVRGVVLWWRHKVRTAMGGAGYPKSGRNILNMD